MDLWVRSQDKKRLVWCKEFSIQEKLQNTYAVLGGVYGKHIVGNYKNRERALEVIDEIQEVLSTRMCQENYNSVNLVYEMPKE